MRVKDLTKRELVSLLELIHKSMLCTTHSQIRELIENLNSLVPFNMGGVMLERRGRNHSTPQVLAFSNYPTEYVREYSSRNYYTIDPTAKDVLGTYGIKYWADSLKKHGKPGILLDLLVDFDLQDGATGRGYGCGLTNLTGTENGIAAFSGLPRKKRYETLLTLIIPHLHQAMSRLLEKPTSDAPHISSREREILQWLMQGKSTWDISPILHISERTVKFHIDNVMKKLDAVNRTHAVAIALRLRLIVLD
ncbi:MAG: LuxR C-terminal-related transcriptional regulator [Nitrospirota bacterium]